MADLRERKAESELMRYCEEQGLLYDEAESSCPMCYESPHRGRVRRVLVCSVCEQGYFNMSNFEAHECHDAY